MTTLALELGDLSGSSWVTSTGSASADVNFCVVFELLWGDVSGDTSDPLPAEVNYVEIDTTLEVIFDESFDDITGIEVKSLVPLDKDFDDAVTCGVTAAISAGSSPTAEEVFGVFGGAVALYDTGCLNEQQNVWSNLEYTLTTPDFENYVMDYTSVVSFSDPDLPTKLEGFSFFMIPEIEMTSSFFQTAVGWNSTSESIVRDYVANGGILLVYGGGPGTGIFLNQVFSLGVTQSFCSLTDSKSITASAAGSPFEGGPTSIDCISAVHSIDCGATPCTSFYGTESDSVVTMFKYELGAIVRFGWDFYESGMASGYGDPVTSHVGSDCSQASNPWVTEILPRTLKYASSLTTITALGDSPVTSFNPMTFCFKSTEYGFGCDLEGIRELQLTSVESGAAQVLVKSSKSGRRVQRRSQNGKPAKRARIGGGDDHGRELQTGYLTPAGSSFMTETTCAIGGEAVEMERCFCVDILVWSIFTGATDITLSGTVDLTLSDSGFYGLDRRDLSSRNVQVTFGTDRALQEQGEIVADFEQTVTADQWPPQPTNSAAVGSLVSGLLGLFASTIVMMVI